MGSSRFKLPPAPRAYLGNPILVTIFKLANVHDSVLAIFKPGRNKSGTKARDKNTLETNRDLRLVQSQRVRYATVWEESKIQFELISVHDGEK